MQLDQEKKLKDDEIKGKERLAEVNAKRITEIKAGIEKQKKNHTKVKEF